MATRFSQPGSEQLRLVEPPAEEIHATDLTEEEIRDVKLLVNTGGYTMEDALEEVLGPDAADGIVKLTLVESPPIPDSDVVEVDVDVPDGAGTNAYMNRARFGQ